MSDDDPPPPLRFNGVMDAIKAAANYHVSFHALPVRFTDSGDPNEHDLAEIDNV